MSKLTNLLIAFSLIAATPAFADTQPHSVAADEVSLNRPKGISVFLTPENVVNKGSNNHIQRFIVGGPGGKSIMAWDTTAAGLIGQIKNQPEELRKNGIWLVYSNPDTYSARDKNEKIQLEKLSKENNIPFFECRAMELPNGWKQSN